MTFKHINFGDSPIMRSYEQVAIKRGMVDTNEVVKTAAVKEEYAVTDNLFSDMIRLATGLREKGLVVEAEVLEDKIFQHKQAAKAVKDDGEKMLEEAHPEGDVTVAPSKGNYGRMLTQKTTQEEILKVVNKTPTGKFDKKAQIDVRNIVMAVEDSLGLNKSGQQRDLSGTGNPGQSAGATGKALDPWNTKGKDKGIVNYKAVPGTATPTASALAQPAKTPQAPAKDQSPPKATTQAPQNIRNMQESLRTLSSVLGKDSRADRIGNIGSKSPDGVWGTQTSAALAEAEKLREQMKISGTIQSQPSNSAVDSNIIVLNAMVTKIKSGGGAAYIRQGDKLGDYATREENNKLTIFTGDVANLSAFNSLLFESGVISQFSKSLVLQNTKASRKTTLSKIAQGVTPSEDIYTGPNDPTPSGSGADDLYGPDTDNITGGSTTGMLTYSQWVAVINHFEQQASLSTKTNPSNVTNDRILWRQLESIRQELDGLKNTQKIGPDKENTTVINIDRGAGDAWSTGGRGHGVRGQGGDGEEIDLGGGGGADDSNEILKINNAMTRNILNLRNETWFPFPSEIPEGFRSVYKYYDFIRMAPTTFVNSLGYKMKNRQEAEREFIASRSDVITNSAWSSNDGTHKVRLSTSPGWKLLNNLHWDSYDKFIAQNTKPPRSKAIECLQSAINLLQDSYQKYQTEMQNRDPSNYVERLASSRSIYNLWSEALKRKITEITSEQ
jgi:hypothetical protein